MQRMHMEWLASSLEASTQCLGTRTISCLAGGTTVIVTGTRVPLEASHNLRGFCWKIRKGRTVRVVFRLYLARRLAPQQRFCNTGQFRHSNLTLEIHQ